MASKLQVGSGWGWVVKRLVGAPGGQTCSAITCCLGHPGGTLAGLGIIGAPALNSGLLWPQSPPSPPGTEPDALKICSGLGKTWLGKKPMQVDQTLPREANTMALLQGGEEGKVSQAPLCWTPCRGCVLGTALCSIPASRKGRDGETDAGAKTAAVLQSLLARDFSLRSQAPVQLNLLQPWGLFVPNQTQDTGNWGLGPPEIAPLVTPSEGWKGFPCRPQWHTGGQAGNTMGARWGLSASPLRPKATEIPLPGKVTSAPSHPAKAPCVCVSVCLCVPFPLLMQAGDLTAEP